MAQTVLLTEIDRTDSFPKMFPITADKNNFYVSITTNNWAEQMFYELPCVRIDVYTDIDGTKVRCREISAYMGTYNPVFPPTAPWQFCKQFHDTPSNCYVSITPIFDERALESHNNLIETGIEEGDIWDTQTDKFDIEIKVITE